MNTNYENEFNETSVLNTYFREIEKIPLLSRDEEYELAVKAKNGDLVARDKLITANSRFVISIAKKFQGRGLSLEDLISEGNIGLVMAVDKFEPEKGFHFISYAVWWIRQSILKALNEKSRMIRLPMNKCNEFAHVYEAKNRLEKDGESSSVEEIAKSCSLSNEQVMEILNYSKEIVSLDSPVKDGEESLLGDFLESDSMGPEAEVLSNSLTEAIDNILNSFSEKERDIIVRRFGLRNQKALSLQEVGNLYGLTKERIRQIEKNVLSEIREKDDENQLKAYLA